MTQNLWYFQHHEVTPGVFPLILFHFSTTPSTFSHCRSALYFFIISIFCSEIQLHSSFSFHQAWKLLGQLTWFMVSPPLAPVQWNEFNLIFDLSIDYGVFTISSFQIWCSLEYFLSTSTKFSFLSQVGTLTSNCTEVMKRNLDFNNFISMVKEQSGQLHYWETMRHTKATFKIFLWNPRTNFFLLQVSS